MFIHCMDYTPPKQPDALHKGLEPVGRNYPRASPVGTTHGCSSPPGVQIRSSPFPTPRPRALFSPATPVLYVLPLNDGPARRVTAFFIFIAAALPSATAAWMHEPARRQLSLLGCHGLRVLHHWGLHGQPPARLPPCRHLRRWLLPPCARLHRAALHHLPRRRHRRRRLLCVRGLPRVERCQL